MSRKPRDEAPGALHHVVAKGNAGDAIVQDDVDRRAFLGRLRHAVERHQWSCFAYCLLDTHFHLVLRTPRPNLGLGMKWLKAAYAQDYNFRHARRGHVFGGRYYSARLKSDDHLLAAIVYVSLNPVRAGVVVQPERWPWSGFAATVGMAPAPAFLDRGAVLELFGSGNESGRERLIAAVADAAARDHQRPLAGSDP